MIRRAFAVAIIAAVAAASLGCGACGGTGAGGLDWPVEVDPLRGVRHTRPRPIERPQSPRSRLRGAVKAGEVSLADSYRYRLAVALNVELVGEVPEEFRLDADQVGDQLLQELAADLPRMSSEDRLELEIWTRPWFDPEHPFHPRRWIGRNSTGSTPGAGVDSTGTGGAGSLEAEIGLTPGGPGVSFRRVSFRSGMPGRAPARDGSMSTYCPQDPLSRGLYRPPGTTFEGTPWKDPWFLGPGFCWRKLNKNLVVSWPEEASWEGQALSAAQLTQRVTDILSAAGQAHSDALQVFNSSADELVQLHGEESIVVGLFPQTGRAFHTRHTQEHRSYIYMPLFGDPERLAWETTPHEIFHALQYSFRTAYPDALDEWLIEGMAQWGAKRISGSAHVGSYSFHDTQEELLGSIGDGLLLVEYPAHLYWHHLRQSRGEGRLRNIAIRYANNRDLEEVLELMELETLWHQFGRALYHREPWKELQDSPEDFPADWQLAPQVERETIYPSHQVSFIAPMDSLAVQLYPFEVASDVPFVQLYLDYGDHALAAEGLEYSVVLPDSQEDLHLEIGRREIVCFDGSDPECEGEPIFPRGRLDLLLSNHDPEGAAVVRGFVTSTALEYRATRVKVGDTEATVTGELVLRRTGSDAFELLAEGLWFGFDGEVYERLIPDDSASDRVNVSRDLIREYIKDNIQFRGFLELSYEIDENADPPFEDGRWWLPLRTSRTDHTGNFFSTPHRFFVQLDPTWFEALGGGTGVLGPGGIVFQRMIWELNRTQFSEGSFATVVQEWFTQCMTLGTPRDGEGEPRYRIDPDTHELVFRAGNTTLWFEPAT